MGIKDYTEKPPNETDDFQRFIELVADMRQKQDNYFRCRSRGSLGAAKTAEKRVDAMLFELTKGDRQNRF